MDSETKETIETRLKLAEATLDRLEHFLFGNGQIGVIKELLNARKEDRDKSDLQHQQNVARMEKIEQNQMKIIWLCLGVYLAWGFLTGSGFATLTHVIETMKH
jgi:hypothetical protein